MNDYKQYNDRLFSRWAPIYDGFELVLSGIRKQVVREIDPASKTILDVATGTGSLAIELSRTAKKVIGIDLSTEMLEVAEKKRKTGNLEFRHMDASQMEFEDGAFDAVTISLGLHDMPVDIRTKVLQEVKRVLKPGGKLYIFEHQMPKNNPLALLSNHLINIFESRYFLDFVQSDFDHYLDTFGFKKNKQTDYLFDHLRLITLSK